MEKDVKSAESSRETTPTTLTSTLEPDDANLEPDVEILSTLGGNEDILQDLVSAENWKQ